MRQLLSYSPGDTFEHLRTQVRIQASLFGEDIDAMLSEKEQLTVFHTICSAENNVQCKDKQDNGVNFVHTQGGTWFHVNLQVGEIAWHFHGNGKAGPKS